MNDKRNQNPAEDLKKLKEIPKWTRRYAQNRTLTGFVLIVMGAFFSLFVAGLVGFSLALAAVGFRKGNIILGCVGIVVLVVVLAGVVIFLIIFLSKFGGKNRGLIDQLIEQRIYGKEGAASIPLPEITKKMRGLDYLLGAIGLICILGINYLSMEGYIAFKYTQPIAALFLVPTFVFEYFFLMRPKVGPFFLLWPTLYAVHAILIVAGVPIFFTGNWGIGNMAIPLFVYAFLAYAIGHIYSRYALKKLKETVHFEEEAN